MPASVLTSFLRPGGGDGVSGAIRAGNRPPKGVAKTLEGFVGRVLTSVSNFVPKPTVVEPAPPEAVPATEVQPIPQAVPTPEDRAALLPVPAHEVPTVSQAVPDVAGSPVPGTCGGPRRCGAGGPPRTRRDDRFMTFTLPGCVEEALVNDTRPTSIVRESGDRRAYMKRLDATMDLDTFTEGIDRHFPSMERYVSEGDCFSAELERLRVETNRLGAEMSRLGAEMDCPREEIDRLREERDRLFAESNRLVSERCNLYSRLRAESEPFGVELERLRVESNRLEADITRLRFEMDYPRSEMDRLLEERERIRTARERILAERCNLRSLLSKVRDRPSAEETFEVRASREEVPDNRYREEERDTVTFLKDRASIHPEPCAPVDPLVLRIVSRLGAVHPVVTTAWGDTDQARVVGSDDVIIVVETCV